MLPDECGGEFGEAAFVADGEKREFAHKEGQSVGPLCAAFNPKPELTGNLATWRRSQAARQQDTARAGAATQDLSTLAAQCEPHLHMA